MDASMGLVRKIIASGQTGVELAALDVAVKLGLEHDGWAPRGMRNEDGPLPEYLNLREEPRLGFRHAMEQNIIDSDGTLMITRGEKSDESRFAVDTALKHHRQLLHVDLSQHSAFEGASLASSWFGLQKIETVFITGPAASQDKMIYQQAKKILETSFYLGFVKTGILPERGASIAVTETGESRGDWPQSVEEAVDRLKNVLPLKDRALMANMQPDEVESLQSGLGEYIKQSFGLYTGNSELMKACVRHGNLLRPLPDEACTVILRALWTDLQASHRLRIIK